MTKRIISALILTLIVLSLVACGGSGEKVLNGTVDELKTALSAANAEGDLMPYDADRLADDIVIKSTDYQEGFFLTPINSAGVIPSHSSYARTAQPLPTSSFVLKPM